MRAASRDLVALFERRQSQRTAPFTPPVFSSSGSSLVPVPKQSGQTRVSGLVNSVMFARESEASEILFTILMNCLSELSDDIGGREW